MKKLFALLLAICLLTAFNAVLAKSVSELSAYSDSELVELLKNVQNEIAARNIEKTAQLAPGTYIGGRDIPAGAYILAHTAENDFKYGDVRLHSEGTSENESEDSSESDYINKLSEHVYLGDDYSFYIVIEDGDILDLPFNHTLTISAGVKFE